MIKRQASKISSSPSDFFLFGRCERGEYRFSPESIPRGIQLIGNGQVGGKARGLIFVADYLGKHNVLTRHDELIRFPDSLIVTTEVFDQFMETNHLRKAVAAGCNKEISLYELQERIIAAVFPRWALKELDKFLEQEHRPLVVRSSSVREDDPDHSFAGIYLSEFLSNAGSHKRRLKSLENAIKRVYASTFGLNARAYRVRHGLPWQREKMAILIQNMIGMHYPQDFFYPLIGGVAFSLNFYPWNDRLKPEDGVVRCVIGVGTRAVGREYARVFSPEIPGLRPEGSDVDAIVRYSQETIDVLDMNGGELSQVPLSKLRNPLLQKICSVLSPEGSMSEPVSILPPEGRYIASFNRFINRNTTMPFVPLMHDLLSGLQDLFGLPVDIEFAINFQLSEDGSVAPLFYLLQARPLGGRPQHRRISLPRSPAERTLLVCNRVLGNGRHRRIKHLIFVDPLTYYWNEAHAIARRVGKIDQQLNGEKYVLIGPGRWATSNPQLGVPVQYGEIIGACAIVEMATKSFSPELSYGTHFYADMVASKVLYLPFDAELGDRFNRVLLEQQEVRFSDSWVTHFYIKDGLDVYVDGGGKQGLICLHRRRPTIALKDINKR